jgi:hypothetical protein
MRLYRAELQRVEKSGHRDEWPFQNWLAREIASAPNQTAKDLIVTVLCASLIRSIRMSS